MYSHKQEKLFQNKNSLPLFLLGIFKIIGILNVNFIDKSLALDVMHVSVCAGLLMCVHMPFVEDRGQPSGVMPHVPPTLFLETVPLIGLDPKESFRLSDW